MQGGLDCHRKSRIQYIVLEYLAWQRAIIAQSFQILANEELLWIVFTFQERGILNALATHFRPSLRVSFIRPSQLADTCIEIIYS